MAYTLPADPGGFLTYNSTGDVIFRSTNDKVEIYVDLDVSGDVTIDDTLTVHAAATFDSTLDVTGVTHLGGTLFLDADLDAQNNRITGAELETSGGGMLIAGDQIDFGSGRSIGSGPGYIYISAANVEIGALLSVTGDVRAANFIPWSVPSITGSRGGNVALADLLASLDALGLIGDGTTA